MSVRTGLVLELQRHLLGPRHGVDEVVAEPQREYLMGVLAPVVGMRASPRDVDADADTLLGDAEEDVDDDEAPASGVAPVGVSPALDPSCQPRALGISFVVRSGDHPTLSVCATWARYERQTEGRGGSCVRRPMHCLTGAVTAQNGVIVYLIGADVRVEMRCLCLEPDLYRISLFLINTRLQRGEFPEPEDFVFQPQIRIVLADGCALEPIMRNRRCVDDADEASLDMLYRNRGALARGHMCAAEWREIDPERRLKDGSSSPFAWCDAGLVPDVERAQFLVPDLRTEYMPLYPVISPSAEWRADEFGPPPELSAAKLAEAYDSDVLHASLTPLPAAYRQWMLTLSLDAMPANLVGRASEHVAVCTEAATRIEAAIVLLACDEEARPAFCFANRVIQEQNQWRGRAFAWRPFQLGFFLLALCGIADRNSAERKLCDLLWFPTGGGKTEAYLGLTAFTLALRRLRASKDQTGFAVDTGMGVLSRYTLRLLTIQQFRRALATITACEMLRVIPSASGPIGWRPVGCHSEADYIWGATRFSAGLWAGKGVTPNSLYDSGYNPMTPGAIRILKDPTARAGEPAQVLSCPCCEAVLAVPQPPQDLRAYHGGNALTLHLVFFLEHGPPAAPLQGSLDTSEIRVAWFAIDKLPANGFYVLSVRIEAVGAGFSAREIDNWWYDHVCAGLGVLRDALVSTRPSRPGYFVRRGRTAKGDAVDVDFEVYCPNPKCTLANIQWREKVPVPIQAASITVDCQDWQEVLEPFSTGAGSTIGTRVPIPAITVDNQIYRRPPSLLVATVDKFARLAFEPAAAALFGNVTHFKKHVRKNESHYGYCREQIGPGLVRALAWAMEPPDLILQDELHLIDGPLGSMVGLYETAIDALSEMQDGVRPKYIASTATVRQAPEQVQALYNRELFQFPPRGLSADDSFFAHTAEVHPAEHLDDPGRLYVGCSAPGKGAQTPIVRIWAVLLQAVENALRAGVAQDDLDPFWTLVGYFNAVRELAGAAGLFRQDIQQWVRHLAGSRPCRNLNVEAVELSSRTDSLLLPALLERLNNSLKTGGAETVALATSMFGTGVDVTRLGLMFVHGQPKSTSSYIQATGRVGRSSGGLVVAFLRASRPRDLDHYEFFTGYHRQLYRAVEPVTVAPFSSRARDRAIGPICTLLLRQARQISGHPVSDQWKDSGSASRMAVHRPDSEVVALLDLFEKRAQSQPSGRRPEPDVTRDEVGSELDIWHAVASKHGSILEYAEYSLNTSPKLPVVLGDPQHQRNNLDVAYENAPQSLREVEATTGFRV